EYKQWLEPAAKLLEQAAAKTTNASLKKFLSLRAQAFRTDDYFQSELAWMDLTGTLIEVAIGPYEVYTDELYGRKTAFESFLTLKDPKESAALNVYKGELRGMEANLPVEERYKNFQRGFESPIAVADQIKGGGDNVPGVQTIAFNLPNDERVREAKGAKKVILRNVLGAKYERILAPMATLTLVSGQAGNVTRKYMFMETLFHELSHSLGPGSITIDGRKTTVDKELKELASGLEEAKADVMGAWNILYMMDKGILPAAEKDQIRATYVAGLFRAMRFGVGEAHGKGAAMQYRYLREKGALVWDTEAKRFRIDPAKIDGAIRDLVGTIVRLQGNGDYAGVNAFLGKYAVLDPEAQQVIGTMKDIPVDIRPVYPDRI
ncbi:MAG: dipeptidyl-peptidase 3 family protein, partial [Sphingomicrobium sp.]